jgi:hypothetical protein
MDGKNNNAGSICHDLNCEYNLPVIRPHIHKNSIDGSYVKYIVEKPKQKRDNHYYDDERS